MQQSLETHAFETAYEKACRQVEVVCESESARQLRLETLLFVDENEELHTQLAQGEERIDDLEQYALDLQANIRAGEDSLNSIHGLLRTRNREIESLKVSEHTKQQLR